MHQFTILWVTEAFSRSQNKTHVSNANGVFQLAIILAFILCCIRISAANVEPLTIPMSEIDEHNIKAVLTIIFANTS
jgi:hypothetical protein